MRRLLSFTAVLGLLLTATSAQAAAVLFAGSSGSLTAVAQFNNVGGNLQVILANLGGDVLVPSDILTAVLFNINGVGPLTPVSALLVPGSVALYGPDGGGNMGGEWG